jgi:hypothetical protein
MSVLLSTFQRIDRPGDVTAINIVEFTHRLAPLQHMQGRVPEKWLAAKTNGAEQACLPQHFDNAEELVKLIRAWQKRQAKEHLGGNAAQRPDVNGRVVWKTQKDFR